MRRREFIAVIGGATAWPLVARAQQSRKIPKVGVLWHARNENEEAITLGALRKGLNDLGYVEGKNIELENLFAEEHYERLNALATELVEAKVDVIVASFGPAAVAAKRATTTIPVIFVSVADPVGLHLVNSLAHPGGNTTGLSNMSLDLAAKHLELLQDCLGSLSVVALLANPNVSIFQQYVAAAYKATDTLRVSLKVVEARSPDELGEGFSTIAKSDVNAILVMPDGTFWTERNRIAQLALGYKLPTIAAFGEMAEAGMLMSYGANVPYLFHHIATYIDKILKGAKPADLPVEQAAKYDLFINLKTAKALGLTIPPTVIARADKVIE
jgi:putative ABC transport system substrate-binding protein